MARTHGRSRLPLPASLTLALDAMGFVPFEPPGLTPTKGPHSFTLLAQPKFVLQAVASGIPGDAAVTAIWPGQPAVRIEIDPLIVILQERVREAKNPLVAVAAILAELGATRG